MNILKEMLFIDEPSILRLYAEMSSIAGYFIAPVFTIGLILEYFGEMNFGSVVKKLFLIIVFMGTFYKFHTTAVNIALESASITLNKVSPRNLFVRKWTQTKVTTKEKKEWNFIQSLAIPNLNDILATTFFLLSKIFIWLLKLIYSSVYHLTYVFAGVTAILYFLGWTRDALKGTIQASLWCMTMPFVIVAILALVGNSIEESALSGDLLVAKVDTIIWLFGITLLLLISPLISYGMIKGDGIHSFAPKMGSLIMKSGMKASLVLPLASKFGGQIKYGSIPNLFKTKSPNSNPPKNDFRKNKQNKENLKNEELSPLPKSNTLSKESESKKTNQNEIIHSKNSGATNLVKTSHQSKLGSNVTRNSVEPRKLQTDSKIQKENRGKTNIYEKQTKSYATNETTKVSKSYLPNQSSPELPKKKIKRSMKNEF
jgi:hypothetical protein